MGTISVIIPSNNENEETLKRCLLSLSHDAVREIIIVECGERASFGGFLDDNPKVKMVRSAKSRAVQMNAGADTATGDLLLFTHADSVLAPGGIDEAAAAIDHDNTSLVSFRLRFNSPRMIYRLLEFGVDLRNLFLKIPYGDQSYLVRRVDYDAVDGFDAVQVLEDVTFVAKLKKRGEVKIVSAAVNTSPRRYERAGVIRTFLRNLRIMVLYYIGFSPAMIARVLSRRA